MTKDDLKQDSIYMVKHTSGLIAARYVGGRSIPGYTSKFGTFRTNTRNHLLFVNLSTGREIEIKSIGKVKKTLL